MVELYRPVAVFASALAGGGCAALLGAGVEPAMFTAATTALAAWLGGRPRETRPETAVAEQGEPSGAEVILDAIDDPLLLVKGQRVTRANAAARKLLGQHIEGEDVRLAIRHPAVTDRLAKGDRLDTGPLELAGLGSGDRRWTLSAQRVDEELLAVRLVDRSAQFAAERMRVDFVANASHELRTPLATLLGFIETLEDAGDDPATRTRFLGIMAGEARRMQRLVDDLMSLSRIEADRFRSPEDAVDLAPLAAEVAATLRSASADPERRVIVDGSAPAPPVTGDRAQLSQLLHNLIGNALKYGRAGTPVRVAISTTEDSRQVRLSVIDEGDGIQAEHIPRLTERFYRVDPGRSRALGGTGLGLAIVKHIIERHRGRLEIASTPGSGTSVTVFLPAVVTKVQPKRHMERQMPA